MLKFCCSTGFRIDPKTNAEMHDRVYAEISQDKKLFDLQRRKAIELLELQADGFLKKQSRL